MAPRKFSVNLYWEQLTTDEFNVLAITVRIAAGAQCSWNYRSGSHAWSSGTMGAPPREPRHIGVTWRTGSRRRSTLNAEKAPGGGGSGTRKHQKEEAPGGGSRRRRRRHQENAPREDSKEMWLLEKALRREGVDRGSMRRSDPVRECPRKKMLQEERIQENGWRMLQAGLETQGWRGGSR